MAQFYQCYILLCFAEGGHGVYYLYGNSCHIMCNFAVCSKNLKTGGKER